MIVGAAGNNAVTVFRQTGSERLSVDDHLPLIIAELRLERFVETNRFCSNDMHQRSTLNAGKDGRVDLFREFFFAHHDAAARATQTLVRRRSDKLRVRDRTRMLSPGDEPGDMGHVDEEKCADRIGDLP